MANTFEVRDVRRKEKFFIDDEYLNGYAKLCGANATLVYMCLCRHSDRNQESFPSIELMAEKTGVSRDSIMRGIKSLVDWNIIQKSRNWRKGSQVTNNTYLLLDKSVWKPKTEASRSQQPAKQVANQGEASRKSGNKQVAVSDTKDTHKKDTHRRIAEQGSAGVNQVIDSFKEVNPSYLKWFQNTTQRSACERMIKTHGLEKVLQVVSFLSKSNTIQYAPTVTTPLQLEDKWAALSAFFIKKRMEINKNKIVKI